MSNSKTMTATEFSRLYPPPTPCIYYPIKGRKDGAVETEIGSEAWELGDGSVVVRVMGRSGGVSIAHLEIDGNK